MGLFKFRGRKTDRLTLVCMISLLVFDADRLYWVIYPSVHTGHERLYHKSNVTAVAASTNTILLVFFLYFFAVRRRSGTREDNRENEGEGREREGQHEDVTWWKWRNNASWMVSSMEGVVSRPLPSLLPEGTSALEIWSKGSSSKYSRAHNSVYAFLKLGFQFSAEQRWLDYGMA